MANRVPLVFDTITDRIKELPSGDNLNLSGSSIVEAINITASGILTANTINVANLTVSGSGGGIAAVALTNNYNDLNNKPILFSGNYNDLTNTPVTTTIAWDAVTGKPTIATKLSELTNDTNFVSNAQVTINTSQVSNLSAVGTSGSFNDLLNVPNFITQEDIAGGTLTIDVNNTGDLQGNVLGDDSTVIVNYLTNTVTGTLVGPLTGNVTGDVTGSLNGTVYSPQGVEVLFNGSELTNPIFRGDVQGRLFGTVEGDVVGSVFADNSSLMVDAVSNALFATNIYATTHHGNLSKLGASLSITSNSGVDLSPGGYFNIPNATTVSINGTSTALLSGASGVTISAPSGTVKILSTVPTTSIGVSGDVEGAVALDAVYMYYCTATYDGGTNIWKRIAWSGDTW
tara:strand:- start:1385 stop:2584 length:1200 start_codon:yes stop_codon:yes gene_type:complete